MTLPRCLRCDEIASADPFMLEILDFLAGRVGSHELYLVGGFLRDFLLGITARDADFITTLDPAELAKDTARRFGGKALPLKEEMGIFRVALLREGRLYTLDFSAVKGNSLEEDLSQRDFTINAMALDVWSFCLQREALLPRDLVDKHYGWRDLKARVLRECSKEAFRADPVRVLRAVRFMQTMGMAPEPRTQNHMKKYAPLLARAPGERLAVEMLEVLSLPRASAVLSWLQDQGIMHHVFPALDRLSGVSQNHYHDLDAWEHTLAALDELDVLIEHPEKTYPRFAVNIRERLSRPLQGPYPRAALLRMAALFHDAGKADTWSRGEDGRIHFHGHARFSVVEAAAAAKRLCLSNRSSEYIQAMVREHMMMASYVKGGITRRGLNRILFKMGEDVVDLVVLSTADRLATRGPASTPEDLERFIGLGNDILALAEREEDSPPLLSGHDLRRELGMEEGAALGKMLRRLREAQLNGELNSRVEALAMARRMLEEEVRDE